MPDHHLLPSPKTCKLFWELDHIVGAYLPFDIAAASSSFNCNGHSPNIFLSLYIEDHSSSLHILIHQTQQLIIITAEMEQTTELMKMFAVKAAVAMIVAITMMDETTKLNAMVLLGRARASIVMLQTKHLQNHPTVTHKMKGMKVIQLMSDFGMIPSCLLSPCSYNDLSHLCRKTCLLENRKQPKSNT